MANSERLAEIYPEMHSYYEVSRDDLPVSFKHRQLMDLGRGRVQHTYASCGRSMAMIAMKVQGIGFDKDSSAQMEWLRGLVPTGFCGIDPGPLASGIRKIGVDCVEYKEADIELLIELLRTCPSLCVLGIQAPWCSLEDIELNQAGHYVAAGHVDLRKREVIVHDTGNGAPWGRIKLKHLPYIWHDRFIGKQKTFEGWMLHVRVKK